MTATPAAVHQLHIDLELPYNHMAVSAMKAKENGYGTLEDIVPAGTSLDEHDLTSAAIKSLSSDKVRLSSFIAALKYLTICEILCRSGISSWTLVVSVGNETRSQVTLCANTGLFRSI